jgi:hypothetical protein
VTAEYEFDAEQNRVIGAVARNARFAGAMNLVLTAAVMFAAARFGSAAGWSLRIIGGALLVVGMVMALTVVYGVWLLRAAASFSQIVTTRGSDITHLLLAFRELTYIYQTQWWLLVLAMFSYASLLVFTWIPVEVVASVAVSLFLLVAMGKVFAKAGHSAWAAVVPIYSAIVLLQVANKPAWWVLLLAIPGVNLAIAVVVALAIARSFGRGTGFAIGLVVLPWVFYPVLGFGRAEYYAGASL